MATTMTTGADRAGFLLTCAGAAGVMFSGLVFADTVGLQHLVSVFGPTLRVVQTILTASIVALVSGLVLRAVGRRQH